MYSINKNYFSDIINEKQAYWLGVIWADGSIGIYSNGNGYCHHRIQLTSKDNDWLNIFLEDIQSSHPLRKTKRNYYLFSVSSKDMFYDLFKHGIIPRKTYSNNTPIVKKDNLVSHVVRGIFDGDGCISGNYTYPVLTITNNKKTCNWILYNFRKNLDCGGGIYNYNEGAYRLRIGGRSQIKKIVSWLYSDATRFLNRKYKKFIELGLVED